MAKTHLLLSLLITFLFTFTVTETQAYYKTLPSSSLSLKRQKLTHLHFYYQEIVSGKNSTTVRVAEASVTNSSSTLFGSVTIIDNPLTEGPDLGSKPVGRAQGMFASASATENALLMNINFVFTEGKLNGSTLSLFGRNPFLSAVREMPIVGGSGFFRFAKGFAEARTSRFDSSGDVVVEYDVYALHYY